MIHAMPMNEAAIVNGTGNKFELVNVWFNVTFDVELVSVVLFVVFGGL
jgi:hypothetical protein